MSLARSRLLAAVGALFLVSCSLSTPTANNTPIPPSPSLLPETSPSAASTPAGTPTSSPTSAPSPTGPAPAISSLPFHNGEVGVIYLAVTLGATGGTPGYAWSISGGTFPPGLNLSTGGVVTGNNTAAGNFAFTVTVTDSAGGTASAPASMHVFSALTVLSPCAGACQVEEGCTICGNFGAVSGGLPPYHLSIVADNRPTGMGVSGLSLTGTFPPPGVFSLTVKVQDSQFGATRTITAHWTVFAHINFTGATSYLCGNSPSSCSLAIPYTGGTPGGTLTVIATKVGPITGVFTGPPPPPQIEVPAPPLTFPCNPFKLMTPPVALPPGTTYTSGGGTLTLNIGPPDQTTWCFFQGEVTIVLQDQSPCGPGLCTSTTSVAIEISVP